MPYDQKIIKRFWEHVEICCHGLTCEECCWPWRSTRWKGYGILTMYDKALYARTGRPARTYKASRLALEISTGVLLQKGIWALHGCNNPPCCNYNNGHVYSGTPRDNMRDTIKAGHHVSVLKPESIIRGDKHWMRRYPERIGTHNQTKHAFSTIETIRHLARAGFPNSVLEKIFCISSGHISSIVRGKARLNY
jgi:hypothetical protein